MLTACLTHTHTPQGEDPDIALEGMEKYLMNKLYKSCFLPAASDDGPTDLALAERLSLMSFVQAQVRVWCVCVCVCVCVCYILIDLTDNQPLIEGICGYSIF